MAATPLEYGLDRQRADDARAVYGPVGFPDLALSPEHYLEMARRLRARAWSRGMHRAWRLVREGLEPLVGPLLRRHRRNVVVRELSLLSDESLRDIGISRADIPAIAESLWGSRRAANDPAHRDAA